MAEEKKVTKKIVKNENQFKNNISNLLTFGKWETKSIQIQDLGA